MATSEHEIKITAVPDVTQLASVARIIAKHLTALADDLDHATEPTDRQILDDPEFERRVRRMMRINSPEFEAWMRRQNRINGSWRP